VHATVDGEHVVSEYVDLLREAYRGEVFGESFFGALAESPHHEPYRSRLRALQEVEAQTAARLRPLVELAGGDLGEHEAAIAEGVDLAGGLRETPWPELLRSLRDALPAFLERFERLHSLAPDDPVLTDLVAHEQAIDRFAALELEGHAEDAIAVLRGHLDDAHRARL
jgi:hypothetical protein